MAKRKKQSNRGSSFVKIICGIIMFGGLIAIGYLLCFTEDGYFYDVFNKNDNKPNANQPINRTPVVTYNFMSCDANVELCTKYYNINNKTIKITKQTITDKDTGNTSTKVLMDNNLLFNLPSGSIVGSVTSMKDAVIIWLEGKDVKNTYIEAYNLSGKRIWTLKSIDTQYTGMYLTKQTDEEHFRVDRDFIYVGGRRDYDGKLLLNNGEVSDYCDKTLLSRSGLSYSSAIEGQYKIQYSGNARFARPTRMSTTSITESGYCE